MTKTWRGRAARFVAFLGGGVFVTAYLAMSEIGLNGKIVGALFLGSFMYLASIMIGDE